MKILRAIFICGLATALISCAHFSKPIDQSFEPKAGTAIIYGRFELELDDGMGNQLALWISSNDSNKKYLIQFKRREPVCCIPVKAGRYNVTGFVGTEIDRRIWGQKRFPRNHSFEVRTNSATYIGDFIGYAKFDGIVQEWAIEGVTNNFVETTGEFRKKFPNFASFPAYSAFTPQSHWRLTP